MRLGTEAALAKFRSGQRIMVSQITFAECLSAFARKLKIGELTSNHFQEACDLFKRDWMSFIERIEVDSKTMTYVPELVMELHAADAIQLSSAIWLNDACLLTPQRLGGDNVLEFIVADEKLATSARQRRLKVFNPVTRL